MRTGWVMRSLPVYQVIPARERKRANPESRNEFSMCVWIPGPALRAVPE